MKSRTLKRLLIAVCMLALIVALFAVSAYACTTIYVGGNLAKDGVPIVARSEDYTNSASKLMYISPSGQYKAGEKYIGCEEYGGFEWTWTHDSYRFDAYTADVFYELYEEDAEEPTTRNHFTVGEDGRIVFDGVCPECGKSGHPSYTEHGTNEKGLTVSSTETLSPTRQIRGVDPFKTTKVDGKVGIEETDIPTVILSECATAREGIKLLLKIYDECGCANGAGLFIADQKEIWYVENTTGTQYIALKLNNDLLFLEPNMPVIGLIDLDDENVIASKRLIEVAKEAGTFVGNEAENQIDFRASYSNPASVNARMVNGLNFVNKEYNYDSAALAADTTAFTISNVKDGKIVPVYTNIAADRKITVDDIANYYKLDAIGNTGNTDTCFFQLYPDLPIETGTVQWTSMSHGTWNVFIPTYPLLTDSLYEAYGYCAGEATKRLAEKPESGMYYATLRNNQPSYTLLPQDWDKNFYWTFDALSNYILYSANIEDPVSEEENQYVMDQFAALQQKIYDGFDALNAEIKDADNAAARRAVTAYYADMSEKTHKKALKLIGFLKDGVSKAELEETIAAAEAIVPGRYVDVAALTKALEAAKTAVASDDQAVVDEAEAALSKALSELVEFRFDDVKNSSRYYFEPVYWAYAHDPQITKGTSATKFSPESDVTRAQAVTFLWRAMGSEKAGKPAAFTDVPEDAYYADAVAWAVEKGITTGTSDEHFSPEATCTRAQIVTFLWRLAEKAKAGKAATFTDIPEGAYYADAVAWALENQITTGTSAQRFSPEAPCTRAQIVTFLYRNQPAPEPAEAEPAE